MFENVSAQGGSAWGGKNKNFAYAVLGLNVFAAWISWWVLADSLYGRTAHPWLNPVLAFSFWGIAFAFGCIFVKNRKYLYSCYTASSLGYFLFIRPGWSYLVAILTILFLVLTEIQIKKETERGIKIDFYHLVSHSLKYFVSIVCVAIALSYYFSIKDQPSPTASGIEVQSLKTEIDLGLAAAGYVLSDDNKKLANDIKNDVTVDEFLSKNWIDQNVPTDLGGQENAGTENPSDTAKKIGSATAEQIKNEMLSKSKRDLSKQLGVPVIGEKPVKDVIAAYIDSSERSFFEYSGANKFYVPILLALGLFLTARILGTAVDLILGLLILGIIKILMAYNIIEIKTETRNVGTISYSV
jgi:hypothetical protein